MKISTIKDKFITFETPNSLRWKIIISGTRIEQAMIINMSKYVKASQLMSCLQYLRCDITYDNYTDN